MDLLVSIMAVCFGPLWSISGMMSVNTSDRAIWLRSSNTSTGHLSAHMLKLAGSKQPGQEKKQPTDDRRNKCN